jgi:hypothetical protein
VVLPAVAHLADSDSAAQTYCVLSDHRIDDTEFYLRTDQRFDQLLELYRRERITLTQSVRNELQGLIQADPINIMIAFVLAQGARAVLAKLNAATVRFTARVAPEEWIHFVCSPEGDHDMGIGTS